MKITILTLFPGMFSGFIGYSIIKRAIEKKLVEIEFINFRDFAEDKYKTVDDHPYGGGAGMIMKVDIVDKALEFAKVKNKVKNTKIILLDPRGKTYNQKKAHELAKIDHIILICGHYEGIDERIRSLADEQISIGDFILTGGELAASCLIDSVIRLLPGVLTDPNSIKEESFEDILEYPQYTRPNEYKGIKVPQILLSGNHKKIDEWKKSQAIKITRKERPDLIIEK